MDCAAHSGEQRSSISVWPCREQHTAESQGAARKCLTRSSGERMVADTKWIRRGGQNLAARSDREKTSRGLGRVVRSRAPRCRAIPPRSVNPCASVSAYRPDRSDLVPPVFRPYCRGDTKVHEGPAGREGLTRLVLGHHAIEQRASF